MHRSVWKLFPGLLFFILPAVKSSAQDFMMQGFYWNFPKTANGYDWADTLAGKTSILSKAGFTYIWLPPFYRASSGTVSNGYDPYDLYDLGGFGLGPTGFGSSADVTNLISVFKASHLNAVADVVYNHRNGGLPENNPVVQSYVDSAYSADCPTYPLYNDPNYNPYPSDRFRYILPLGASTGNGAGDYYIKISSISQKSKFFNFPYTFYAQTNTTGYQNQATLEQIKPDGGSDCSQPFNTVPLGVDMNATTSDGGLDVGGCFTDEYHVHIGTGDFNPAGDTLFIYITNQNTEYSDHRIYGVVNGTTNITSQLVLQTWTDFTHMASGRGGVNYLNFHPNGIDCSYLGMNWDYPFFFYDYDQTYPPTADTLIAWTQWLWSSVGVRGLRLDDVSQYNPQFAGQLLTELNANSMNPGLIVGEDFDYTISDVTGWVNAVKSYMSPAANAAINVRAFDFPLRNALKSACDQVGFDVRGVYAVAIAHNGLTPQNAVTFVNNHDLRNAGDPIQNNTILAYAYTFTDYSAGMPSVFYPDYFGVSQQYYPTIYLKSQIDSLISLNKRYIYNSTTVDYLNAQGSAYLNAPTSYLSSVSGAGPSTTLIYQISGDSSGKDVLVAINFAYDTLKLNQVIDTHGGDLSAGTVFYDAMYQSDFPSTAVSSNSTLYLELPPRSFSVWVDDSALAVSSEIIQFTATPVLGQIQLSWETMDETNTSYFNVMRSSDSIHWSIIGKTAAAGNSETTLNYSFNDNNPLNGTSYYQIHQVDLNGSSANSVIRSVNYESSGNGWKIFPNPSDGMVHILGPQSWNTTGVRLVNAKGESFNATVTYETPNNLLLDMSRLASGIYIVEISSGTNLFRQEIEKN